MGRIKNRKLDRIYVEEKKIIEIRIFNEFNNIRRVNMMSQLSEMEMVSKEKIETEAYGKAHVDMKDDINISDIKYIISDASWKNGKGAYSFIATNKEGDKMIKVSDVISDTVNLTPYRSELEGIYEAILLLKIMNIKHIIYVLCDCQSIIQNKYDYFYGSSFGTKSDADLMEAIADIIQEYKNIKLIWIKGHQEKKFVGISEIPNLALDLQKQLVQVHL